MDPAGLFRVGQVRQQDLASLAEARRRLEGEEEDCIALDEPPACLA